MFLLILTKERLKDLKLSKEELEKRKEKNFVKRLEKSYKRAETEIGKTYGFLTIIGIDKKTTEEIKKQGKSYGVYVFCKCKCGGEIKSYRLSSIKTGHTYSCGCSKFNNPKRSEDLTGKKFGRLTVIGRDIKRDKKLVEEGKSGNSHWLCKCDCGNSELRSVTAYQLKSEHTQSCGCYASEKIAERNKKYSTKINRIEEKENTIILYDDNNNECVIDKEDYKILKNWYWRKIEKRGEIDKGYWVTNSKIDDKYQTSVIFIHQIVAEIKYGEYNRKEVMPDHLSRDTDDNRKCNIYLKSNQGNCKNRSLSKANSSGKTGVYFEKSKNAWIASITVNYKTKYLGAYKNFEDAVKIRKEAEEKYGFTCDENVAEYDKVS